MSRRDLYFLIVHLGGLPLEVGQAIEIRKNIKIRKVRDGRTV